MVDDLGHSFYVIPWKKKERVLFDGLSLEQQESLQFLMNVPPANSKDNHFNVMTAMNIVRCKGKHDIRKAIMVYKERIARGERPKSMEAYLKDIIEKGCEPVPVHSGLNKDTWDKKKRDFPPGCYQEGRDSVVFTRLDKEVTWRMSPDIFNDQLNRIKQQLKEY